MPDAVGHELVEAETEFRGPFRQADEELGVEERLAAGEAERVDARGVRLFQKADRGRDVEAVGPLDRHAAMRTTQIALIGAGEGEVVRTERARPALHRSSVAARQGR